MNTSPIALHPDLVERVRRITRSKGATVEDFVNQAVRERLEWLEDQKLEAEVLALLHRVLGEGSICSQGANLK